MARGMFWKLEPEAAGYMVSVIRQQRVRMICLITFSLFSPGWEYTEWCLPNWVFSIDEQIDSLYHIGLLQSRKKMHFQQKQDIQKPG